MHNGAVRKAKVVRLKASGLYAVCSLFVYTVLSVYNCSSRRQRLPACSDVLFLSFSVRHIAIVRRVCYVIGRHKQRQLQRRVNVYMYQLVLYLATETQLLASISRFWALCMPHDSLRRRRRFRIDG